MALTNLNYKSSLTETANNTLQQREPQLMTNVNQRIIKVLASSPIIYHLSSFRSSLNVLFSLSLVWFVLCQQFAQYNVTEEEDALVLYPQPQRNRNIKRFKPKE